jgi:polysaccharide export outer membrane protein
MRLIRPLLALALLVNLAACASAPRGPAFSAAPVPKSFGLRAGDVMRVRVWREPDLSGDYIVDEYGKVSLPVLGPRVVLGESSESLQKKIQDAYAATLKEPSVQVTFLRRVAVQGDVRVPGLYPMDATMTVGDALAVAGGRVTPTLEGSTLELWRDGTMLYGDVPTSVFIGQLDMKAGDELRAPPGSWSRRNGINGAVWIQIGLAVTLAIIQIAIFTR